MTNAEKCKRYKLRKKGLLPPAEPRIKNPKPPKPPKEPKPVDPYVARNAYRALKIRAIAYLGGSCAVCGYDRCPAALEFHHKNKEEKEFQFKYMGWERLVPELDKCALLCANCHREHHWANGY